MVLVGYWPLKESSGDTAYDHSGNENHGTINDGGDSTVPGAQGVLGQKAYSFDGSNDVVVVSDGSTIYSGSNWSISGWVYFSGSSDEAADGMICLAGNSGQAYEERVYLMSNKFELADTSSNLGAISFTEELGKWVNLIVLKRGSELIGYKNGVPVGRLTTSNPGKLALSNFAYIRFGSGKHKDNVGLHGTPDFISGRASEVRIYNHALTPREVQYLHQVGKRGRQVTSSRSS